MQIKFHSMQKTETVIFKSKQEKFEGDLKIKLCGKWLYPTESVKYLGVKIDTNLIDLAKTLIMISPLNWIELILFSSK